MTLTCPSCAATYAAANVNLSLGLASCESCGTVTDLTKRRVAAARTPPDPAGTVVVDGPPAQVSWTWRGIAAVFLVVWCVVWDGMLASFALRLIAGGEPAAVLMLSGHALAGVAVTYLTAAMLVNRTTITVGSERVAVEHGPLPWRGQVDLPAPGVSQVYVTEVRGRKGARSWTLHAELEDGTSVQLVSGLATPGRARFLEDWLEARLGLVDRPVAGEHA